MTSTASEPRTERRVLGGAVRRIRELQGRSLRIIAKDAGMTAGYWCKIEQGTQRPSLAKMTAMANALGVDLGDITYPTVVIEVSEDAA